MVKSIDVGQVKVAQLIGHRVPRRKGPDDKREPALTDALPSLPPETLDFFGARLKKSLAAKGQDVEVDPKLDDPRMPRLVRGHLASAPRDLVATSQTAARYLFESQGGSRYEDESLFVTLDVSLGGQPAISVMKLEKESGVEWDEETNDEGETVLMVSVNPRLFLTDNTRVFKAALFALDDAALVGIVSDDQQGQPTDVAEYFMRRFLGCRPRRSPAITTRDFYRTIERFISEDLTDPGQKLDVEGALKTELNSNRKRIDPVDFVSTYVPEEHQDLLLTRFRENEVPTTTFSKDLGKLGAQPRTTRLKTASGITIAGSAEEMSDRVRPGVDEDGAPTIIVRDTLLSTR